MTGRFLAVDPGMHRIGLAISDEQGILAAPLTILQHVGLKTDCTNIVKIALEKGVVGIIVGQPVGDDSEETRGMRHSLRVVEELRNLSELPIHLWDESYSTQDARNVALVQGFSREKRKGHMDDLAAAQILQSFLDSRNAGLEKE